MTYQEDKDDVYDPPIDNIIKSEINSWFNFGNAMKNKEGQEFFKMLNECLVYEEGAKSKGPTYSTESLILGIILNQQRLIRQLMSGEKFQP